MNAHLNIQEEAITDDAYFLDIEVAYRYANKQLTKLDENGRERLIICYYDGPLTDITLENFIQISSDQFAETFSETNLPIPGKLVLVNNGNIHIENLPEDIIEDIAQKRRERAELLKNIQNGFSNKRLEDFLERDTYFVDPFLALNQAKLKKRVYCNHPTIDGLQVCYYRGELPEHRLANLVHLELRDFETFFIRSRLRMPEHIEFPTDLEEEIKASVRQDIASLCESIKRKRLLLTQDLMQKAKAMQPGMRGKRTPRIFIPSNRLTTVMQYSSKGMSKAFADLGWEVLFYIQANDMETSNIVHMLEQYIDFDPIACFCVNNLSNGFMHDDVVNMVWWQDLMPQLKEGQPLNWRTRDFNFSISPLFDRYLEQCQAPSVQRLHFAIDEAVFYPGNTAVRADKVVFVGSSYLPVINLENSQHQQALDSLIGLMARGACFDEAAVSQIAAASSLSYEFVFWKLLHYVIRDHAVRWLCSDSCLPVDVYGRYWDQDAAVAPFYRGELAHGEAVAEVYRAARYALVCHPFEINSQRLAEVAACGCIPLVYDCRDVAEPPHWDDYCLFFKTAEELQNILRQRLQPAKPPQGLAEQFTYKAAARRLIDLTDLRQLSDGVCEPAPEPLAVLPGICGDNLLLLSRLEAVRQTCLANLQANLACLAQFRPELHKTLLAAWTQQRITAVVDQAISGEYWRVLLERDGKEIYRPDNIALLEHKHLIAENTAAMSRENSCCYAFIGAGSGYELLAAFRATELPIAEMAEFEVPLYLIESKPEMWLLNLLLHDLRPLLASQRLRVYHDVDCEAALGAEFAKFEAALPDMLFNLDPQAPISAEHVYQLSLAAKQARAERHALNLQQVIDYYNAISLEHWRRKFSPEQAGELRVLGFISRFSSFLKYGMRDWLDGFERLGATIRVCSETENYYLSNIEHLIEEINDFKPDLILTMDHFRHEYEGIPDSIPFVNWIQDMLPNILENDRPPKVMDFTFSFVKRWLSFNELDIYKQYNIEFLPVGYNDKLYFPLYQKGYACDVLSVTHLEEPGRTFEPLRNSAITLILNDAEIGLLNKGWISEHDLLRAYEILEKHCSSMTMAEFEEFCTFHAIKTFNDFKSLFLRHNVELPDQVMEILICVKGNRLHFEYLNRMKTWPVALAMRYYPRLVFHLYGKNWNQYPQYAEFSKGVVENGEALNNIMNRAKICLNSNPGVTLHMRALEIMGAGAFMLSRQMVYDGSPLTDYFTENEVVIFDDEADFVHKLKFYLDDESARSIKAENARQALQKHLSYRGLAGRVLNSIHARLLKHRFENAL